MKFSQDRLASLILVAMVLLFNYRIVLYGEIPFFRDLPTQHYPYKLILAESLRAGELPLWSKALSMGFPFLANPAAGVFYPLHLIFLALPFFQALGIFFVLHYLIAAAGAYLLCRRWDYQPYLALTGAMLFAFGGMTVSLTSMMDFFQTAVWLPWLLLTGERFLQSRCWRDFVACAFVMTAQFFAGHPETYAMCQALLLFHGLSLKSGLSYRERLLLLLAVNLTVLGLAMVQILPAAELFLQSWRFEALPYTKATVWSLKPQSLVNLFFLDKEVDLSLYNGLEGLFSREQPLFITLYLGAVALPALVLWLLRGSAKEKALLLGLIGVTVLLAMGRYGPLYPLLFERLPGMALFRFPEKFFFVGFQLILLVVLRGLRGFLHAPDAIVGGRPPAALFLPLLIFLLPYLFFRLRPDLLIDLIAQARQASPSDPAAVMFSSAVLVQLERQIFLTSALLALIFLWATGRLRTRLFEALFVALIFFDLASAHQRYHFSLPPEIVGRAPKIVADAGRELPYRFFYLLTLSDLHPNSYAFIKRRYPDMVSNIFSNLIPNSGLFYGVEYLQELESLRRTPYQRFLDEAGRLSPERLYRLLGALNVKYINSFQPLPDGEIALVAHFPQYPAWLYAVSRAVPRAYVAAAAVVEKEPRKVFERLSDRSFDPLREVIVERPVATASRVEFQAQVKFLRYTNREAALDVVLKDSGLLVLTDSYDPGWRAYVNGMESTIPRRWP